MDIKKISSVVFSPTESTKKTASLIAGSVDLPVVCNDITLRPNEAEEHYFGSDECVIFAVPVYSGRVPFAASERIKKIHGDGTPAIIAVTYGNRDYDDALLELRNIAAANGFVPIAAAAVVTQHSIMRSVAVGRPDREDVKKIESFADAVFEKLKVISSPAECKELVIKGNVPYKEYGSIPLKPASTKNCIKCGICAENCPVGAIPADSPSETDKSLCISCMRCVKVCPYNARELDVAVFAATEEVFMQKNKVRKEPEFF